MSSAPPPSAPTPSSADPSGEGEAATSSATAAPSGTDARPDGDTQETGAGSQEPAWWRWTLRAFAAIGAAGVIVESHGKRLRERDIPRRGKDFDARAFDLSFFTGKEDCEFEVEVNVTTSTGDEWSARRRPASAADGGR